LLTEQAAEIRQTSHIIKHSKPQRTNTSKAERDALRALRGNQDTSVLPSDKGNASVVVTSKFTRKNRRTTRYYLQIQLKQLKRIMNCRRGGQNVDPK
jgi:hypothetical protein